jgi:hypothetical protein
MENQDPNFAPTEVLYIGRRQLSSGKLAEAWVPAESPGVQASLFAPTKTKTMPLVIGAVYRMDAVVTDNTITNARMGKREYVRMNGDDAAQAGWEALDRTASIGLRTTKQLEKLKGQSALEQDLLALRRHYHKLPWSDRIAFEVLILSEIRKAK